MLASIAAWHNLCTASAGSYSLTHIFICLRLTNLFSPACVFSAARAVTRIHESLAGRLTENRGELRAQGCWNQQLASAGAPQRIMLLACGCPTVKCASCGVSFGFEGVLASAAVAQGCWLLAHQQERSLRNQPASVMLLPVLDGSMQVVSVVRVGDGKQLEHPGGTRRTRSTCTMF